MKILCLVFKISVLLTNAYNTEDDIKPTKPNNHQDETQQKSFDIKSISNESRIVLRNNSRNDKFRKNYDYYSNYGAANNFAINSEYNKPNNNPNPNQPSGMSGYVNDYREVNNYGSNMGKYFGNNIPVNHFNQHVATPKIYGLGENLGKITNQNYDYYSIADGQAQRTPADQGEEYNNYGKDDSFNKPIYSYDDNYGRQGYTTTTDLTTTDSTITDFTTTDFTSTDFTTTDLTTTDLTSTDLTTTDLTTTDLTTTDLTTTDLITPEPTTTDSMTKNKTTENKTTTQRTSTTISERKSNTTTSKIITSSRMTLRTTPGPTPDTVLLREEWEEVNFKNRFNLIEPYQLIERDKFVDLEEQPLCSCPRVYWPACATNNITYLNICVMNCIGATLKRYGTCINY